MIVARSLDTVLTITIFLVLSTVAGAQPPAWESDLGKALERAKNEKRDVLLAFLGPDTSDVCKKMNQDILGGIEFRTVMGNEYVLFSVPAPEDAKRDEAQQKVYRSVLKKFHVTAYPIALLATPDGKVYGETRLQRPQTQGVIRMFNSLRSKRGALEAVLAAAGNADQPGGAKNLSDALDKMGYRFAIRYHGDLVEQVIRLDPDNKLGLAELWKKRRYSATSIWQFDQIYGGIAPFLWQAESPAEKIKLLDKAIGDYALKGEVRQLMEWRKYHVWRVAQNFEKMLESAHAAQKLAPNTLLGKTVIPQAIERTRQLMKQSKTAEPPNDEKPAETKPAETKPAEAKPAEAKPADGSH